MSTTIRDIRKITGRIGAEIIGVDVTQPLDEETVSFVRAALAEHKALVFKAAPLDDEGQQRFAAHFGELTIAHPTVASVEGAPQVLPVDSERGSANHWHTDVTFVHAPPKVSTLSSKIVPPHGGETLIANTGAAYRDLPEPLRRLADGLWAVHTNDYDYAAPPEEQDEALQERRAEFTSQTFETEHPVVRVHPQTGSVASISAASSPASSGCPRPRAATSCDCSRPMSRGRKMSCGSSGSRISSSSSTTRSPSTTRPTTMTVCRAA